jgi:magnesium-transporting ATPase (P-type)
MKMNMKKFASGFLLLAVAWVFLVFDFFINDFDVLPDSVGFLLAGFGIFRFILYRSALVSKEQWPLVVLVLAILVELVEYFAGIAKVSITGELFLFLSSLTSVLIAFAISVLGYFFARKHVATLRKSWERLAALSGIAFFIQVALSFVPLVASSDVQESFSLSLTDGEGKRALLATVMILVLGFAVMVYSLGVMWRTYSRAK